jgi:hypothetical protein
MSKVSDYFESRKYIKLLVVSMIILALIIVFIIYKQDRKVNIINKSVGSSKANLSSNSSQPQTFTQNSKKSPAAQEASTRAVQVISSLQNAISGQNNSTSSSLKLFVDSKTNSDYFTPGFKAEVDNGTALNYKIMQGIS